MIQKTPKLPFPQAGEIFELTATEEITPMDLVDAFGETSANWRSKATRIHIGTTLRFKLLEEVECRRDFATVVSDCREQGGKPTSGCWMKVFNDTFGSNGFNPVGVPDDSWMILGRNYFPMIHSGGLGELRVVSCNRGGENWLWLVEVDG